MWNLKMNMNMQIYENFEALNTKRADNIIKIHTNLKQFTGYMTLKETLKASDKMN